MTIDIDLRDRPVADYREHLFDALEELHPGDELTLVADEDLDPHLVRYQLAENRSLDWEYADPDAEPRELTLTVGGDLDDGQLGSTDVRDLKPQRRHEALLTIFDELAAGEGFVLVNDHDPKPLYHELRSSHGDVVDWAYARRGDGEWRVEIRKTGESESTADDVLTRYDVRDIPEAERHPTIHHRYGMIPDGGTMEIIAPHEPQPLRREFRERYGDDFEWKVVESEPGRCRVRITKVDTDRSQGDDGGETTEPAGTATPGDQEAIEVVDELDVRELPPAQRHDLIFEAYDQLDRGTGFVLVNDHDPKPLYHQFDAEAGPAFRWTYRKRDPGEFRVMIGKAETEDETTPEGEPESSA